jgi:hypothetical protein
MRKLCMVIAAALLAGPLLTAPAVAQDRHERHDDRRGHGDGDRGWRDRDVLRFRDNDFGRWRDGRWFEGRHGGRIGWWWIVGGAWYFYPQPIYPYPDPFLPPVIAGPPPGAPVYYFCPRPRGYYPYIAVCPTGWRAVPAG